MADNSLSFSRWIAKVFWGRDDNITLTTIIWRRQDEWPYNWMLAIVEFFNRDHFDKYR